MQDGLLLLGAEGLLDGAAGLHPAVVTASDNLAVMNQHRADRDPAFGKTFLRLFDSGLSSGTDCMRWPSISTQASS